jgi:hypothetical protein
MMIAAVSIGLIFISITLFFVAFCYYTIYNNKEEADIVGNIAIIWLVAGIILGIIYLIIQFNK